MGAYVMKTCFQTSTISSAMFITAMAANPLAVNLASEALGQPISWGAWALAGIVPGLICLVCTPLILYFLYPPGETYQGIYSSYAQCNLALSVYTFPLCVSTQLANMHMHIRILLPVGRHRLQKTWHYCHDEAITAQAFQV